MTSQDQARQGQLEMQRNMIKAAKWTTCLNCEYWDHDLAQCGKFEARPPAEVVVIGCEHWLDVIPF